MSSFLDKCPTKLWINGKWCDSADGGRFDSISPPTGKVLKSVSAAGSVDIDAAVSAAKACLHSDNWGYKSTGAQRAVILRRFGEIIKERMSELVEIECADNGKPRREAEADFGDAIGACNHFADLAEKQDKDQDEEIDVGDGDFKCCIRYEPLGIIGGVTPWNYPFLMGIWKVVPAVAAGCCIVLKPSELAPLTCLLMGEMLQQAGLPDGALNVVPGLGPVAGAALSAHEGVDKLSFTGSVPTAKRIMTAAAEGPRNISLELGGKSPLIAFEDSDIVALVDWIITGFCWGSGQVCSATSRVFLHKNIRADVLDKLVARLKALPIGNMSDPAFAADDKFETPMMGPVISKLQYDKIWAFIDEANADSSINRLYGGERSLVADQDAGGYFIPPTVYVDVPNTARVWKEEIFGPVLCVREFETEEEVLAMANDSDYGLAGAVFSADLERCSRVTNGMRCGTVWINNCQPAFIQMPWGGVKKSGFGRELGRWGLEEFTSVKQVTAVRDNKYKWGLW
jgi:betaine-aldehyde dehydrogenase